MLQTYIRQYKKVISKDSCNYVIDYLESTNMWERHSYIRTDGSEYSLDNEPDIYFLDEFENKHLNDKLIHEVFSSISLYKKELNLTPDIVTKISNLRVTKYKTDTYMAPHYDHVRNIFSENSEDKGIPIFSLVGCLNNNYTGGELIFEFFGGEKYPIKFDAGDILIFPSNYVFPHYVTRILSGNRYTFVGWCY